MKPLSIQQIRQAVGGKALTPIPATAPAVSVVCTDTRRMQPGCLFVAINGDNFNAHDFLPDAAKGGAVAALVQQEPEAKLPNLYLINVPDTRIALGKLATYVRLHMRSKVIGVAGSNGKTSTKYLIDSILGSKLRGSMSPKSFNNDIGVPLTILPADPTQDYLVLEMGTNHPGEIKVLTEMARPDIAVITNCGAEHLEFLGDLMGVRQENSTIIRGMSAKGLLVVNGDEPELISAISPYKGKKITFGFESKNDLFAADVRCDETGTRYLLNGRLEVFVPMLGRHTASNSLAAIAVGRAMRMNEADIISALAVAHGPDMSLQLQELEGGVSLLNDAYNANPNSMRAALETAANLQPRGRRVAVLGDMRELGKSSERYHKEIGEFAAKCGLHLLGCVGDQAQFIAESAERAGMPTGAIVRFKDSSAAANEVPRWLRDGDLVLLKASRSIHLERVAQAIIESRQQRQQQQQVNQHAPREEGRVVIYLLIKTYFDWLDAHGFGFLRVFIRYANFQATVAVILSFLLVIFSAPRVIAWLRRMKIGDLPSFDQEQVNKIMEGKKGTPTMGGILIITAIAVTTLLLADMKNFYVQMALICLVWLGAVGAVDDWLKLTIAHRTGSRQGLTTLEKLLFQIGLAVVLAVFTYHHGQDIPQTHTLYFPFFKNAQLPLGIGAFIAISVAVVVGASNAVNLTDGLDGLASGTMAIVSFTFLVLTLIIGDLEWAGTLYFQYIKASDQMAVLAGAMAGACLGFLWFNCNPASVFMGDTGALALGGLIGYIAIVIRQELMLFLVGGIFVAEAVSVIIQVSYFKYTKRKYGAGRRIFLMTPLHHHFQRKGWTETQVVTRFWLIGAMLAAMALATVKLR